MHTAALTFGLSKGSPPPLDRVRSTISTFLGDAERLRPEQQFVTLIVEEWLTNLLNHGCGEDEDHVASMILTDLGGAVRIQLEDDCAPFDPTALPPPPLEADVDGRRVGGLGVHLIKSLVDQIRYRRTGGRNLWELEKRIGAPAQG